MYLKLISIPQQINEILPPPPPPKKIGNYSPYYTASAYTEMSV